MDLKRYYVDLRLFPVDERLQLADKLERFAFIFTPFLDKLGLYEVFWDNPDSIAHVLGISGTFISTVLPKN